MPRIKNLAALAAAVQYGRSYARKNPEKAGRYVDQAAAFVDKQTKGKYSGQIDGLVDKVKGAAGLPRTSRHGVVGNGAASGFESGSGLGRHEGYGRSTSATSPVTPSTTTPSTPVPPVTPPSARPTDLPTTETGRHFPGSRDV